MQKHRFAWTTIVVAAGVLQGWDSGVLRSTIGVQTLVVLAIAAPAAAFALMKNHGAHAAMVAASFVLLTVARMVAPTPLPTLHLIAFVPALMILLPLTRRPSVRV